MAEYEVLSCEKVADKPDAKYGPAKILRIRFVGEEREPEWFTKVATPEYKQGAKVRGEIEDGQYGPRWKPERKGGAGGGGKTPAQESRIVRQHSQEMAVRVMAILGRVLHEEQFRNLVGWFESDAYGKLKSGVDAWPMTSDVPADTDDLFPPE